MDNPRACVLVRNDSGDLLLIHRMKDGRDYWVFPGGSIESGETPEMAAIREAKEELSLDIEGLTLSFVQDNSGRTEYYFDVARFRGSPSLGLGPEAARMSSTNVYEPRWVPMSLLKIINLLPESAKNRALSQCVVPGL